MNNNDDNNNKKKIVVIRDYEEDPNLVEDLHKNGVINNPNDDNNDHTSSSYVQSEIIVTSSVTERGGGKEGVESATTNIFVSSSSRPSSLSLFGSSSSSSSLRKIVQDLFLPIGYPQSVDAKTYLPYQLYDGLQGLCSYWRGVVSAQAVFAASGVGDANRTALSAAITWALRDGTGMVGGLFYSYLSSHYFDIYVKEFRLVLADVINDVALTLDLLAPYFGPTYSVYILTLSTMGKTICGITAGATKGRITHHFARKHGNMADLTAKESTQETLVSLIGMIGGVWVAQALNDAPLIMTWIMFGILTLVHVWANYRAVAILKLDTLNPERTRVLFGDILDIMTTHTMTMMKKSSDNVIGQHGKQQQQQQQDTLKTAMEQLSPPDQIEESMISSIYHLLFPSIRVSRSFDPLRFNTGRTTKNRNRDGHHDGGGNGLRWCSLFHDVAATNLNYVIGIETPAHKRPGGYAVNVYIWLKVGSTMEDELQAYLHAMLIQRVVCSAAAAAATKEKYGATSSNDPITLQSLSQVFQATAQQIQILFDTEKYDVMNRLSNLEWDVETRLYLGYSSRRLQVSMKDK